MTLERHHNSNRFGLPGNLYPLPDNQYPSEPWAAQNDLQRLLRITYCDGLRLPALDQIHVVNEVARKLVRGMGPNFAIIFTRGAGLAISGNSDYGHPTNNIVDEGMPTSHNIPTNDIDAHVVTFVKSDHMKVLAHIAEGMHQGCDKMLNDPSIRTLTPYSIRTSKPNVWNMPRYLSLNLTYFATSPRSDTITTLEIHHENLPEGNIKKFLGHYQIWKSNLIGSPMAVSLPDENGNLTHHIWQPFDTETKWSDHFVSLTAPERFDESAFCIPQATRIILGILHASLVTDIPARLDPVTIETIKQGLSRYEKHIQNPKNSAQREKAIKQLNTTLYLARRLKQTLRFDNSHLIHQMGDFQEYVVNTLDEVGWGEVVLDQTVKDYVTEN